MEGNFKLSDVGIPSQTTVRAFAEQQRQEGAAATVLSVTRNNITTITSMVLLTSDFGKLSESDKDTIVVHELLHYVFNKDDAGLKAQFGIDFGVLLSDSAAITEWLRRDCYDQPGAIPQ